MKSAARIDRDFALLFTVMLTIAAGNTALQSVLPALGRSLHVPDSAVAAAFSVSALLWVIAAPVWARRSDRHGRRAMILLGVGGFCVSLLICGIFLAAGINGWIGGTTAFVCFILGRLIYGTFGSAAPPAVQALVAGNTTRAERTKALTLLGSAFGLGTILGPTIAPFLVLGTIAGIEIGLSGPAFLFALFGLCVLVAVRQLLPNDLTPDPATHGAANAYPSIGGQSSGASIVAATEPSAEQVRYRDPRIRPWLIAGLIAGNGQAMTGQAIGFLVIDRLHLEPASALQPTGIVLMIGALAALVVQWGIIPNLDLRPRAMMLAGLAIAALGCALTGNRHLALHDRNRLCARLGRVRLHPPGLHRGRVACGRARRARIGRWQGDLGQRRRVRTRAVDRGGTVRSPAFAALSGGGRSDAGTSALLSGRAPCPVSAIPPARGRGRRNRSAVALSHPA